jgi:hypothetical protein
VELAVQKLAAPLVAFALARLMLTVIAKKARLPAFQANTWGRWDTAHYLSIAQRGYEFFSCAKMPGYDPKLWCGNTAWLPGYPMLMHWLAKISGLPYVTAGATLSGVLCLVALILVWNLFLNAQLNLKNSLVLALAAFFPGQIYDHAIFPISLLTVLALLALYYYIERRYLVSGVFGAAAAFSYGSGLFLAGALGTHWLFSARKLRWQERAHALVPPSGVAVGFVMALLYQFKKVHVWNAYVLVQAKYEYAFRTPFEAWHAAFAKAWTGSPRVSGPSQQTLLVAVLCTSVLVVVLRHIRELDRTEAVLTSFMLFYWLVPLMLGGQLSIYRAEATILPAIALFRRAPTWLLIPGVVCAIYLSTVISRLFFLNQIM